jgi:hypothetical protein
MLMSSASAWAITTGRTGHRDEDLLTPFGGGNQLGESALGILRVHLR